MHPAPGSSATMRASSSSASHHPPPGPHRLSHFYEVGSRSTAGGPSSSATSSSALATSDSHSYLTAGGSVARAGMGRNASSSSSTGGGVRAGSRLSGASGRPFQPRIVSGTYTGPYNPSDFYSSGSLSPSSPSASTPRPRTRIPSNSSLPSSPPSSSTRTQRTNSSTTPAISTTTHIQSPARIRPPYVDHSALRRFILLEPPSSGPSQGRLDRLHRESSPGVTGSIFVSRRSPSSVSAPSRDSVDSDDESVTSFRERSVGPTSMLVSSLLASAAAGANMMNRPRVDEMLRLPTMWNVNDRCNILTISEDGFDVTFNGNSLQGDKEAAAVRANFPIPPACGVYYYEVEIRNKGLKGHIGIGFGKREVHLTRLPGWDVNSWGYHGDDGNAFASPGDGSPYGPKFTTGDVIGCGIDFRQERAFYTKNGTFIGMVFEGLRGPLYPFVGFRTSQESIRANFGQRPFVFDIEAYFQEQQDVMWTEIQSTRAGWKVADDESVRLAVMNEDKPAIIVSSDSTGSLPTTSATTTAGARAGATRVGPVNRDLKEPISELILDYLIHHGYSRTAQSFKERNRVERDRVTSGTKDASESSSSEKAASSAPLTIPLSDLCSTPAPPTSTSASDLVDSHTADSNIRQRILSSILVGDIDTALSLTEQHYPSVLEMSSGMMLFRLKCRKLAELTVAAGRESASEKRMAMVAALQVKGMKPTALALANGTGAAIHEIGVDIGDAMDVDEVPAIHPLKAKMVATAVTHAPPPASLAALATERALEYGRLLHAEYQHDERPAVQSLFQRTVGLLAYHDPLEQGGEVGELAGQKAREELAESLNSAILESLGRPTQPVLERLYRHTDATVVELGLLGIGQAAFADVEKEFAAS